MKKSILISIAMAFSFAGPYNLATAQMTSQSPSNRPPQTNSQNSINTQSQSGKVATPGQPATGTNMNQNTNPTNQPALNSTTKERRDARADGTINSALKSKNHNRGKINNQNPESLNQHPVPGRANDPSRDAPRLK